MIGLWLWWLPLLIFGWPWGDAPRGQRDED